MPLKSLNKVAEIMEIFAVFNYQKLAIKYPQYYNIFNVMAETEWEHKLYFMYGPEVE